MRIRRRVLDSIALAFTFAPLLAMADALETFARLSIEPQPVSSALLAFSDQTKLQIVSAGHEVRGLRSPGVQGNLSTAEALRRLLDGTGLSFELINEQTVRVFVAQDAKESALRAPDEVVVVGTNIPGGQAIGPLTSLSEEDIERIGAVTIREVLRTLPQNAGGGVNELSGSFQFVGGADRGGQEAAGTAVNLRGLGSASTLTLLNGRRFAPAGLNGAADVSQIPLAAVERIEVLADGASAIYGSDALGGVVNFVLKDDFEGAEVGTTFGEASHFASQLYAATVGQTWNLSGKDGRAILSYELFNRDELRLDERPGLAPYSNDTYLIPRQHRNSVFFHANQALSDQVSATLTSAVTSRTSRMFSRRPSDFSSNVSIYNSEADVLQAVVQAALDRSWGGNWRSQLAASASWDDMELDDTYPGGRDVSDRRNRVLALDAGAAGDVAFGSDRTLGMAFGAQFRQETLENEQNGIVRGSGPEYSRDVTSAFVEARTRVLGDARAPAGFVELSLAGRWDQYSDFGSTVNPRVAARWVMSRALELSATLGTGFRAPVLIDSYGDVTSVVFAGSTFPDPASPTGVALGPVLSLRGSNPGLEPEESASFTLGVRWSPPAIPELRAQLTYYDIDVTDAIEGSRATLYPEFAAFVTRSPSPAQVQSVIDASTQFFDLSGSAFDPASVYAIVDERLTNLTSRKARGLDVDLAYLRSIGPGAARFDLAASRVLDLRVEFAPTSTNFVQMDKVGYPTQWRVRGSMGYEWSAVSAGLTLDYVDEYTNNFTLTPGKIEDWLTADLRIGFDGSELGSGFLRGLSAAIVIRNLTDERPPRVVRVPFLGPPGVGTQLGTSIGYDPANADPIGRMITMQLSKRF